MGTGSRQLATRMALYCAAKDCRSAEVVPPTPPAEVTPGAPPADPPTLPGQDCPAACRAATRCAVPPRFAAGVCGTTTGFGTGFWATCSESTVRLRAAAAGSASEWVTTVTAASADTVSPT